MADAGSTPVPDVSRVSNKMIRAKLFDKHRQEKRKLKKEKKKRRRKERESLGDAAPPIKIPRTIENTRYEDPTAVAITTHEEEVQREEERDEFSQVLRGARQPKIMLTTGIHPTKGAFDFIRQMLDVLPSSFYYKRGTYAIQQISAYAVKHGFTDVLVFQEHRKELSLFTHCHLPFGPTAVYRISSYVPRSKIPRHGNCTSHIPEVILNNFGSRLGRRTGRMLASLFPHQPNFVGRQVVTFHNQRDFIFFRFHRYIFAADGSKARLQEIGPRFTIKLQSIQRGLFDPMHSDYEFIYKDRLSKDRRQFHL